MYKNIYFRLIFNYHCSPLWAETVYSVYVEMFSKANLTVRGLIETIELFLVGSRVVKSNNNSKYYFYLIGK